MFNNSQLEILRTLLLLLGWPLLLCAGIFFFYYGHQVAKLVKKSLVGDLINIISICMVGGLYSFGILATMVMFMIDKSLYLILLFFLFWLPAFILPLRALSHTYKRLIKEQEKKFDIIPDQFELKKSS